MKLLSEIKNKKVVFTFGRFQPPTIGHQKMIEKIISVSKKEKADIKIYLSQTQDKKKNPLSHSEKINFLKKGIPQIKSNIVTTKKARTPFEALGELVDQGYTDVIMIVGEDRVNQFENAIRPYINHPDPKKSFNLNSFKVISAGSRDPDSSDVSGMSSSKLRDLVLSDDFGKFMKGIPKGLNKEDAQKLFKMLQKALKENFQEPLIYKEEKIIINKNIKSFKNFCFNKKYSSE